MYSRACTKLFVTKTNPLKGYTSVIFQPILRNTKEVCLTTHSHCSNIDVRFSSTKATKQVKQVYYGVLTPQIKAVKIFSLSSSIVGIISQPFLYNAIASTGNIPIIIASYSFIGFFTVVTPFLLHFITKKYVTHLEYKPNTDSYVARTVNFFCIPKTTEFKVDEVKIPDVPGMFTTFQVKGTSLFLDPRLFEDPDHYAKIMGYDKPIDFKLYENVTPQPGGKKV